MRKPLEERVWLRACRMAHELYGYEDDGCDSSAERERRISESVCQCRIFAMAYTQGWLNGRKARTKKVEDEIKRLRLMQWD